MHVQKPVEKISVKIKVIKMTVASICYVEMFIEETCMEKISLKPCYREL